VQQSLASGQIEIGLRLRPAVTFHTLIDQDLANVLCEDFLPFREFLGVIRGKRLLFRRRGPKRPD